MRRMGGLARMRRVLLLAGLALAVLPAGSALADTTIGQTGGDTPCSAGGGTVFGDTHYVVPSGGGTITSFSFVSTTADSGIPIDFVVLRPGSGSSYTVVGKTGEQTLSGLGTETFAANIPVLGGDIIGFWASADLFDCGHGVATGGGAVGTSTGYGADPSVGTTVSFIFTDSELDLNESANLVTVPTSKDQCKNGGWQNYVDNNGTPFKNQGDCVSFVATGGKNPANG